MKAGLFFVFFVHVISVLHAQKITSTGDLSSHKFIEFTQPANNYYLPYTAPVKNALGGRFLTADTLPFLQKYLYSQTIIFGTAIVSHTYILFRTGESIDEWPKHFKFSRVKNAFIKPPVFDYDHWTFNYGVHGGMGQLSYLACRNRGAEPWEAFTITGINTLVYEYVLASSTQAPSISDIFVTPVLGLFAGEASFQLIRHFKRDHKLTFIEKAVILGLDPFEVARNGFSYNKLLSKPF